MIDTNKHKLLEQAQAVTWAIERCGASIEITHAVVESQKLLKDLDNFLKVEGVIK